jgi:Secretion system C-terminal sorting domain
MKNIFGIFLAVVLFTSAETKAQIQSCSQLKFSGVAPFPWAINGQINDWETILGTTNNNPFQPFGTTIGANGSYDTYGNNDPDNPDPTSDIRASAIIHDDYNVYFYVRRLHKSNTPNKAFYFLDPNMDGLMQTGEPVIIINFNAQTISNLSLGRYLATNQQGDNISNKCIVDGFSMVGGTEQTINSVNATLQSNEIFSAAITENGYGVELAVPWRLISNYKYFTYHLALQQGNGQYDPSEKSDNTSGCGGSRLDYIGAPDFFMESSSVQTLVTGSSYRITTTYRNQTPGEILVSASGVIDIENIVSQNNLPVDETQFIVTVNGVTYTYISGSFINQPIKYAELFAGFVVIPAFGTGTIVIDISFPPNGSVKSATINIQRSSFFYFIFEGRRGCVSNIGGGGGKPINPIGIELGDETTTKNGIKSELNPEANNYQNKVIVYPNPFKGFTNVVIPDDLDVAEISITDYTGKLIRRINTRGQRFIRIDNLGSGFYLLNIYGKKGKLLAVKKVISQ